MFRVQDLTRMIEWGLRLGFDAQEDDLSSVPSAGSTAVSSGLESGLSPAPAVLSDHLHKTGGTGMRAVFERLFGSEAVSPALDGRSVEGALQRGASYRAVIGHFLPSPAGNHDPDQRQSVNPSGTSRDAASMVASPDGR